MRRWTAWLLALVLALSLTACGAGPQETAPIQTLPVEERETAPEQGTPEAEEPRQETPEEDGPQQETVLPEGNGPLEEAPPAEGIDAPEETLPEDGVYDGRDDVALYLHTYGHLPNNYITKREAQALGWPGGSLEPYAPGKCIGGSRFGNYEGLLPEAEGRTYTECDIGTLGAASRGAKRICFSNDGLIYYTDDHYKSFTLLYGEAEG